MDNNMNLDDFNNINVPVSSKTSFVDDVKSFFKSKKRTVVAASSFLVAMVMTGSVFYIAYKTYSQKNMATNTGAANPSCYLELSLATPTPSATPIACNKKLDIALVIDRSSTMRTVEADGRTKLVWAKEAASNFVQALIDSGTTSVRVSVSSFGAQGNDGTGTLASSYNSTLVSPLTNNFQSVLAAINNIQYVNSGTCIECGIRIGNSQLSSTTNRKIEILLSDGKANHIWNGGTSNAKAAAITVANAGRASGIEYRALGYGVAASGDIDEATLISVAGSTANYQYKPNVSDWTSGFLTILRDICGGVTVPTAASSPVATATPVATTNIISIADTYVKNDTTSSTKNYNNEARLSSDGSPVAISYIKFDLTSLAAKTVTNAILRLTLFDPSAGTQKIYTTTGAWTESTLTYNNRPTIGTTLIASFKGDGLVGANKDIDLTNFIIANRGKIVTLVINSTSTDGFDFNSREASTGKPTIIVK